MVDVFLFRYLQSILANEILFIPERLDVSFYVYLVLAFRKFPILENKIGLLAEITSKTNRSRINQPILNQLRLSQSRINK